MTKSVCAAISALIGLIGCGGESDDPELGQTQQDVAYIPTYGARFDLADSNTRCLNGGSSQSCVLPPSRTITVRVTGTGMTASQKTTTEGWVDGWIAGLTGDVANWTMTRINSGVGHVNISQGSRPGNNPNSIHNYVHAFANNTTLLNDFGSTGDFFKYGNISCTIDRAKIFFDYVSPQADRVWNQAVLYCANKGLGLGSASGQTVGMNSIVTNPVSFKNICFTPREKCFLQNYNPATDPTQIFPISCPQPGMPCLCAGLSDSGCASGS